MPDTRAPPNLKIKHKKTEKQFICHYSEKDATVLWKLVV